MSYRYHTTQRPDRSVLPRAWSDADQRRATYGPIQPMDTDRSPRRAGVALAGLALVAAVIGAALWMGAA